MPLTALDPNTALIVIDLQKDIVNGNFIHPIGEIIDRTRALIDVFRAKNLPVVLVNVAGRAPGRTELGPSSNLSFSGGWTDLLPQLDHQPSDIAVTKRSWGAFATTDIERQLKARGATQVVVTGVATSGGVEATARQAYEQGFNVTLALDAMTDIREEAHEYCIRNVFPRVGETGSTQEIISLLETRRLCIMNWLSLLSYFFGGVFAANAIPHFVAGTMGRPFQSPFAKLPGQGLSSATVNVVWGFFNAVVGYLLVAHVGAFHPRATNHILAFGLGALLISISSARHFGQFHGGNMQSRP
jgi:nicotinamidase-related amidase